MTGVLFKPTESSSQRVRFKHLWFWWAATVEDHWMAYGIFPSPIHDHFSALSTAMANHTLHVLVINTTHSLFSYSHTPVHLRFSVALRPSYWLLLLSWLHLIFYEPVETLTLHGNFFYFLSTPQFLLFQVHIRDRFTTALLCSHSSLACKYFLHCTLSDFI